MITVIAKNQTINDIAINTLSVAERIIPGSGQTSLTDFNNIFQIIANKELEALINSDDVLLNVNGADLNKNKSLAFLNLDLGAAITTSLSGLISLDGVVGPVNFDTDQHNFTTAGLDNSNFLWLNPTAPNKSITGIVAPIAGINQVLFLLNTNPTYKFTLKNNDANSSAANRFMFKGNLDLDGNNGAVLVYSHADQRWKCVAINSQ
jgi:hypothetical protein